jgi:hypothetical protein
VDISVIILEVAGLLKGLVVTALGIVELRERTGSTGEPRMSKAASGESKREKGG